MATSTSKVKTSLNWADKVIALLTVSDEGRVQLFGDYAAKNYQKGIAERKKRITNLNEEMKEFKERAAEITEEMQHDLETVSISVRLDSIKSREEREKYFQQWDTNLSDTLAKIDDYKESVKSRIAQFEANIKNTEQEIVYLEQKLQFLS